MPRLGNDDAGTDPDPPQPPTQMYRYHDDPMAVSDEETLLVDDDPDHGLSSGSSSRPSTPKQGWTENIADRIPLRAKHVGGAIAAWVRGPDPPRIYKLNTVFPHLQHAPLDLLDEYAPKKLHKFGLLMLFYLVWILMFVLLLWRSSFAAEVPGYGAPKKLSCAAPLWYPDNTCGINGDGCRPFQNYTMAFRCPARCGSEKTWNKRAVGAQEIHYKPFVIGGAPNDTDLEANAIYRGDSFVCQAAVHAGFISDADGGCGALEIIGEQSNFPSTTAHGIESIVFDSYFAKSFKFTKGTQKQCKDQRAPTIIVFVLMTFILSIFTTSPAVLFWTVYVGLFFVTGLVTDPPNLATYSALIGLATTRFLPATFCMAIMYKYAVKYTLTGITAQIEKSILWLVPLWIGVLNNYTLDRIPIRRLTPHDLQTQSGAILALVIIVLCIFSIALAQAWSFRVEGRMPRYLALYGILCGSLLLLLAVPGMHIRIHHYILALLFLPGTALQTRLSIACQGLLVGLFLNGIARWGFDGLLQLPEELFQGDHLGTLLPAVIAPVVGFVNSTVPSNITFSLGPLPGKDKKREYDGYSILVNDVERLRTYRDSEDAVEWDDEGGMKWTWSRHRDGLPEYFRFAYMSGAQTDDYTKAGTWTRDGEWVPMKKGPSN